MVDYTPNANTVPQGSIEPGLFILPTYTYGVSPLQVTWEIHATPGDGDNEVIEYAFNPGDGKPVVRGAFENPAYEGVKIAVVSHTYTYTKSPYSQYTGRTFYPDVTVKTKSGAIKSLNHQKGRYAAEIWVRDGRFD